MIWNSDQPRSANFISYLLAIHPATNDQQFINKHHVIYQIFQTSIKDLTKNNLMYLQRSTKIHWSGIYKPRIWARQHLRSVSTTLNMCDLPVYINDPSQACNFISSIMKSVNYPWRLQYLQLWRGESYQRTSGLGKFTCMKSATVKSLRKWIREKKSSHRL